MYRVGPALGPGPPQARPGPGGPGADSGRENQDMRIRSNMTSGDVLDGLE